MNTPIQFLNTKLAKQSEKNTTISKAEEKTKHIYRLTTAALLFSSAFSLQSHAKDLEEVFVTASPLGKNHDELSQPAAALSDTELREKAAATLGETLNGLLGVSSSSFGPGVGLPIIRGQSDNRVKVMQDSIGTMDASAASPDHAVSAEPLLANRIEVLRGPAALRYGSGAIGGVVNVFDNRIPSELPNKLEGGLEVRYATVNEEKAAVASLTGATGNIAWHVDGVTRSSDNLDIPGAAASDVSDPRLTSQDTLLNTDADAHSGSLGLSYIGERGFIGLSVNKSANNYGVPPEAFELDDQDNILPPENVRIDMEQTRFDLKGELNDPFAGFSKLSFRLGNNDYEHTEIEDGEPGTKFTNKAWEGRAEAIHNPIGNWQGAVGVQLAQRTFAAIGEEAFIPESDISNQGLFILEQTQLGDWGIDLGARVEQQRIEPVQGQDIDHTSVNVSASTSWRFTDTQRLSLTIARSQRAPSVEELLADGGHPATGNYLVGNSELNEETSNNIELGFHWDNDLMHGALNVYYNQIDDFIYARATGQIKEDFPEFEYSQQDATFKGIEAETSFQLTEQFSLRVFGDTVLAELNSGEDVPRIPPARIGSDLRFSNNNWSTAFTVLHAYKQDKPGLNESATDAYTRIDASINYTLEHGDLDYLIFLKATNLSNEEIRNATSFLRDVAPEAGRSLQLGFRVSF